MGVDAILYVSRDRYDTSDLEQVFRTVTGDDGIVLRSTEIAEMYEAGHLSKPPKKPTQKTGMLREFVADGFMFDGERRNPYVHMDSDTPVGRFICITCRSGPKAIKFLRAVGEILGGIFDPDDCDGKMDEFLYGKLNPGNGLAYHLKDAVLSGQCDGERMDQLNEAAHKWIDRIHTHDRHDALSFDRGEEKRREMHLFPRTSEWVDHSKQTD